MVKDASASAITDKIKDILMQKSAANIDAVRPQVAAQCLVQLVQKLKQMLQKQVETEVETEPSAELETETDSEERTNPEEGRGIPTYSQYCH